MNICFKLLGNFRVIFGIAKFIPYCFLGPESNKKFLISTSMVYATMKG